MPLVHTLPVSGAIKANVVVEVGANWLKAIQEFQCASHDRLQAHFNSTHLMNIIKDETIFLRKSH